MNRKIIPTNQTNNQRLNQKVSQQKKPKRKTKRCIKESIPQEDKLHNHHCMVAYHKVEASHSNATADSISSLVSRKKDELNSNSDCDCGSKGDTIFDLFLQSNSNGVEGDNNSDSNSNSNSISNSDSDSNINGSEIVPNV